MDELQTAYLQAIFELQPYARGAKLRMRAEELSGRNVTAREHIFVNLGKLVRTQKTKKGIRYRLSDAGITALQQITAPDRN